MRRIIPILRGLAIVGVVLNHANWHVLARFVSGQFGGYPYIVLDQLAKFAIPAFMFIAGYFISYATSGGKRDLSWSILRSRLGNLLWPWLIWSGIMLFGNFLRNGTISIDSFLYNMFVQYYFVPLLIFFYLLSPFVVKATKRSIFGLLMGSISIQLLAIAFFYFRVYWLDFPNVLNSWVDLGPFQYLRFAFYFPLGLVVGIHFKEIKTFLLRYQRVLWVLTVVGFILSVVEAISAYQMGGEVWPIGGDHTKLSSALFSSALILSFICQDRIMIRANNTIIKLGTFSYGIYLSHYIILGVIAEVVGLIVPWMISLGWLSLPFLLFSVLAAAVWLQEGVARLFGKRVHRYLFG